MFKFEYENDSFKAVAQKSLGAETIDIHITDKSGQRAPFIETAECEADFTIAMSRFMEMMVQEDGTVGLV